MAGFEAFYNDVLNLAKKHEQNNTHLKIEFDKENDILKIFGEHVSALGRAKNGQNDVAELAYTTAEHHPYWNLLYSCSEISEILLERWEDNLSNDDLNDMEWSIDKLKETLQKIKEHTVH